MDDGQNLASLAEAGTLVETENEEETRDNHSKLECRWGGCGRTFASPESIARHVNEVHVSSKRTSYVCEWTGCSRKLEPLPSKFAMTSHLRRHTGERPYKCDGCQKSFTRSDALAKHAKTQHPTETHNPKGTEDAVRASFNSTASPSPQKIQNRLKRILDQLEADRYAVVSELAAARSRIKRLRAEKVVILELLLAKSTPDGS